MMFCFDDKVVIVIGVGGGLGCFYVFVLVECGVKVVVNDLGGLVDGLVGLFDVV